MEALVGPSYDVDVLNYKNFYTSVTRKKICWHSFGKQSSCRKKNRKSH